MVIFKTTAGKVRETKMPLVCAGHLINWVWNNTAMQLFEWLTIFCFLQARIVTIIVKISRQSDRWKTNQIPYDPLGKGTNDANPLTFSIAPLLLERDIHVHYVCDINKIKVRTCLVMNRINFPVMRQRISTNSYWH